MNIPSPPGVFDIIPINEKDPWHNSYLWNYIETTIRQLASQYGFREIRTPIFERTELFLRGMGEGTDIVSKEMYTFEDKGGRSMSLRPEGTAPVMRSLVEQQLYHQSPIQKLFYIAPMFRYERTQAGRYRQHHQFGLEAIGVGSPEQDVEVIDLVYTLYQRLGLTNLSLYINSIGDAGTRNSYKTALKEYLARFFDQLSPDSKNRFESNPLRILDSKDPNDIKINEGAPSILDFLSGECRDHFEGVQKLLAALKIPYEVKPRLVRGLDYYNKTVFEIVTNDLGAQNSLCGGGRYDGLLKTLGGPDLPAMGFGTGLERVIQTMLKQGARIPNRPTPVLFFIPLGEEAKSVCFSLTHELRSYGLPVEMDFTGKKLNKVMQYADQIGSEFVAVVGDQEIKSKEVELKEMATGEKFKAPLYNLRRILEIEATSEEFIQAFNMMTTPLKEPLETQFFLRKLNSSIQQTSKASEDLQLALESLNKIIQSDTP